MAEGSLKDKTVKGVAWSGIDNVAQMGVTFLVSIVLARLLTPDDYGLIGIILVFTAVSNAIIDGGFSSALIRQKHTSENDYDTVFILNLVVSIILYFAIFFSSPFISSFFGRIELVDLTRVMTLTLIIGALGLVHQTILIKNVDFKTQAKITFISSFVSGVIGVVLAVLGEGVWALVFQQLSCQSVRSLLLWLTNKWRPHCRFYLQSFNRLFGFGWKMMCSVLLDTIWKEMNQVIVGRFYSPYALGQYTRSNQFSQLFSSNLTSIVQKVTYPVLSSIQDDRQRMVSAYRKVIKATMFVTAISMFFLAAISEPLIICLIGPQWHDAAIYLPLICISGSSYPLQAINLNMLKVLGRSDLFLGIEIIKKILVVCKV